MSKKYTIRDILNLEANVLEHVKDFKTHGDIHNVMIVVQFADGHVHSHLPAPPVAQTMISHVIDAVRKEERGNLIIPGYKKIDGM